MRDGKAKRRADDSFVTAVAFPVIVCTMAVACIIAFMYSYIFGAPGRPARSRECKSLAVKV
jgi:nitrate reductase NapE component